MQSTSSILTEIVNEILGTEDYEITEESNLIKDLDIDSINLILMVVKIEERFGITLPDEFLSKEYLSDCSSIIALIENTSKSKYIKKI